MKRVAFSSVMESQRSAPSRAQGGRNAPVGNEMEEVAQCGREEGDSRECKLTGFFVCEVTKVRRCLWRSGRRGSTRRATQVKATVPPPPPPPPPHTHTHTHTVK